MCASRVRLAGEVGDGVSFSGKILVVFVIFHHPVAASRIQVPGTQGWEFIEEMEKRCVGSQPPMRRCESRYYYHSYTSIESVKRVN